MVRWIKSLYHQHKWKKSLQSGFKPIDFTSVGNYFSKQHHSSMLPHHVVVRLSAQLIWPEVWVTPRLVELDSRTGSQWKIFTTGGLSLASYSFCRCITTSLKLATRVNMKQDTWVAHSPSWCQSTTSSMKFIWTTESSQPKSLRWEMKAVWQILQWQWQKLV